MTKHVASAALSLWPPNVMGFARSDRICPDLIFGRARVSLGVSLRMDYRRRRGRQMSSIIARVAHLLNFRGFVCIAKESVCALCSSSERG